MKPRHLLMLLTLAASTQAVCAQGVGVQESAALPAGYTASPVATADKAMVLEADGARRKAEASLGQYLVAFDSRYDSNRKQVGLPLASLADDTLHLAYDPSGKNVMAQWRFAQTSAMGQKFNYQAYVGESGVVNFVISSKF